MKFSVEKLIPGFKGLSHTQDGKAVIIDGALPGEVVDAAIIKDNKNYIQARAVSINQKSAERVEPLCDKFGICGGCELLHLNRESEKKYKDAFFSELFSRFPNITIEPSVFKEPIGSRDRARIHIKDGKKGFMARSTNEVVDIPSCPMLSGSLNKKLSAINAASFDFSQEMNIISQIPVRISGLNYSVSEDVFFQSNFAVAASLLDYVSSSAIGESAMDIYAGVGFFSKALEANENIKNIIAIEENPLCKPFAHKNLSRTVYISSPFEKFNPTMLKNKFKLCKIDTVIIDPPRSGLSKKALSNIAKIAPERIIYVSCNIKSNINDIAAIVASGAYHPLSAKLFDMYPATTHIEAVVILSRQTLPK